MTRFEEILGHRASLELLARMRAAQRIPHALLLQGPEGVGKATVARAFAASLLCESPVDRAACDACTSCNLFSAGSHPDFSFVGLLPKTESANAAATDSTTKSDEETRKGILIEQIRDLSQRAGHAPRMAQRRVFMLDPADRMMIAAQNALLKTLEEPPGNSTLLLIASRPHLLLPTIRSRCFSLPFAALRSSELAGLLESRGYDRQEALARASLAEGRPGVALELDIESLRTRRDSVLDMLESLSASPTIPADMSVMAAELAGKTETDLVQGLWLLQALLRDAARAGTRTGDPNLVHIDAADRLQRLGRDLDPLRAASLVRSVERLRADLRFNLNRMLVAESLLAAVAGGPLP
jgi:DNA polymerase-3 subunit delta'